MDDLDATQVRREDTNVRLNQKGINKDVAMKIFSKLCIKDLVRFKCVSKYWDRIISDPILTKLHINPKATVNTFLLLDLENGEANVSWLPNDDGYYGYGLYKAYTQEGREVPLPDEIGPTARVLGYVDGLICLSGEPGEILLYNPSTRECRVLTLPDRLALPSKRSGVDEDMGRLEIADTKERSSRSARNSKRSGSRGDTSRSGIIDTEEYETCSKLARPSKMSDVNEDKGRLEIVDEKKMFGDVSGASGRRPRFYLGGIGYDWKTCDYKVVVVFFESYKPTENNKVMVFPLRENSRREVRGDFPYLPVRNDTHRIPVNGAIHWFVRDQNQARVIVSFDLSTEEVREIPVPDHMDYAEVEGNPHCRADLGALEGRLAVILHNQYDERRSFYVHVWLMGEYGVRGSWRKVKLHETFSRWVDKLKLEKPISCWYAPMFLCKNGKVWVGDPVGMYSHLRLSEEHDHKDCIATPMGFLNTMLAFQASLASPFGELS